MGIGGAIGCHDMNCQIVLRFFYHIAFCMLAISRRTPIVIQLTLSVLASSLTALVTGGVEAEAPSCSTNRHSSIVLSFTPFRSKHCR